MSYPLSGLASAAAAKRQWQETERYARAAYLRKIDHARHELLSDSYFNRGAYDRAEREAFASYNKLSKQAWRDYQTALEAPYQGALAGLLPLEDSDDAAALRANGIDPDIILTHETDMERYK